MVVCNRICIIRWIILEVLKVLLDVFFRGRFGVGYKSGIEGCKSFFIKIFLFFIV